MVVVDTITAALDGCLLSTTLPVNVLANVELRRTGHTTPKLMAESEAPEIVLKLFVLVGTSISTNASGRAMLLLPVNGVMTS
jgi:hypothetical protein